MEPPASPEAPASPDREPPGPPSDVVTSYEDLPHDLFGESGAPPSGEAGDEPAPGPEAHEPDATAATPRGTSRDAVGEPRAPARPAPPAVRADGGDDRGDDDGNDGGDDAAIAMVQSLFPGRIVALEPDESGDEDEEGDGDGASDVDLAAGAEDDDGDDDGDPDVAGDGARGRSG